MSTDVLTVRQLNRALLGRQLLLERSAMPVADIREVTNAAGDSVFADMTMDVPELEVVSHDDSEVQSVVVRAAARASGGRSGAPVSGEVGQVWTYVAGVPKRFEQFRSWEEARRAAGLAVQAE